MPLTLVQQVLRQAHFPGGTQQDAAECLMHLLQSVDQGNMQRRVCGAFAAMSVENMIHCPAAAEAQVSRDAPPVAMGNLLMGALTDEHAIQAAPPALVIRVENTYEQNDM